MRKVLLIAYSFPPRSTSGVYRSTKFVKYLPEFGWQPVVITTIPTSIDNLDQALLDEIPTSVSVHRVATPSFNLLKRLRAKISGQKTQAESSPNSRLTNKPESMVEANHELPAVARFLKWFFSWPLHLFRNPPIDNEFYWSLRMIPLAYRIIKQEQVEVIVSTVPPWSLLLSGCLLKLLTRKPWVADFRDPWTDNTFIYFPSKWRRRLDEVLERNLITRADAVISVTQPWVEALRQKVSDKAQKKPFVLIPNGWDEADRRLLDERLPVAEIGNREGVVTLIHPGSAYEGESSPILQTLELLSAGHDQDIAHRLLFKFVGYMHPQDRQRISDSPCASQFQMQADRIPHEQALQLMRESHVLLLLRKGPDASSGKIFEYMIVGRPVLAIAQGVAADLVRETGIGCAIAPDDTDKLAKILRLIATDYPRFVKRYYQPQWDIIQQYERKALTERLAKVLDALPG